jgi:dolichol-phosphate mannosyltransferase
MCKELHKLGLDADVLFVDDNSPDGTGRLLDEMKPRFPRLSVHHRTGKLGIGSAHLEGIAFAYAQGYTTLVTLDCDFTHSPSDIPKLLAAVEECDMAVGSRWLSRKSLPGWNWLRRALTNLGHLLTKHVLGIPQDASGAFRAYRLDRIPRALFDLVRERGYAFFFESLFIVNANRFSVAEIPIVLPARTYGHSKMNFSAAWRSARFVFELKLAAIRRPEKFLLQRSRPDVDARLSDPQDWDAYWSTHGNTSGAIYEVIAGIYRRGVIKPNLESAIRQNFPNGGEVLHAGCGSGQVDTRVHDRVRVTALDISPNALELYSRNNSAAAGVKHGSILALPFRDASFDGVYNLGVMEHFTRDEIARILREFHRVLKPSGRVMFFWPMASAPSVHVLGIAHLVLNLFGKRKVTLHPPEISLLRSESDAREYLRSGGFRLVSFKYGVRDLFTQAVVVAEKDSEEAPIPVRTKRPLPEQALAVAHG